MPLLLAATLLVEGVFAGVFVGSALVEHAARTLPAAPWIQYRQAKERVFGRVMPPWLLAAVALPAACALLDGDRRPALIAATLLIVAAGAVTLGLHLPLNRKVDSYAADAPPDEWREVRQRWQAGNWGRTALAVAGFACCIAAASG